MTTVVQPTGPDGQVSLNGADPAVPQIPQPGPPPRRASWFKRDPAWPVVALLAGWPIWWALGIENHIFAIMAIPVVRRMYRWWAKGERTIRFPPGFGIWMLFALVAIAGFAMLNLMAPGTIASSTGNRLVSFIGRNLDYGGVTLFMVYAGNLTERELPRRKLAWLLGLVAVYTVAGGMLGVVDPHFGFTSPLSKLLPQSLQPALSNPTGAQIMGFLGYAEARVKAPFNFTNTWGNCLAILLPWLAVAWRTYSTSRRQRLIATLVLIVSVVPAVVSLNRGLWIAAAVGVAYLAARYAAAGKLALLGVLCGTIGLAGVLIAASPLGSLVSQRLAHGKSNTLRSSLTNVTLKDAEASPILGYGDTRHVQGSTQSIAIGSSSTCKKCGNQSVGSNGQIQLTLVANGFVGTALYMGFFAYGIWRYRRDKTPYGIAGVLVLVLGFVFMPVYDAGGPPLGFTLLAYALLWRNDREMRLEKQLPVVPGADSPGQAARPGGAIATSPA